MPNTNQTPVGRQVERLLQRKRPLSYDAIAAKVREAHPDAHTTARSVASVASSLRKAGVELPDRRKMY